MYFLLKFLYRKSSGAFVALIVFFISSVAFVVPASAAATSLTGNDMLHPNPFAITTVKSSMAGYEIYSSTPGYFCQS